ncbi:MAG: 4-hydroxy-tetrahydrodipicolinate reductase [Candidatus Goldbacteria bacterium]|nr:4-hydroxy-tetrahydrodipicolinate reductase [Candidatus Goldiibacteriota bacterium]
MIKIGIAGAAGKMGSTIASLCSKENDFKITLLTEMQGHKTIGTEIYGCKITDNLKDNVNNIDVYIDFTTPQSTLDSLKILKTAKKPAVIGTTGFKDNELIEIKNIAFEIPIVLSSNYSIGINVILKLLKDAVKIIKDDYDIDIVESHHRMKKDAPSGTAITLAKAILEEKKLDFDKNVIYARQGRDNERPRDQIGIFAVRGGGVIGEHTIIMASTGDKIEIKHTAFSRETFAAGAIKAARFIINQKPGLYSMKEVLGI